MWKYNLEQIKQNRKVETGEKLNKEKIMQFTKTVKTLYDITLPIEYIEFLYETNGFKILEFDLYNIEKFIKENATMRTKDTMVFGESYIDLYIYNIKEKKYCVLDKTYNSTIVTYDSFEKIMEYISKNYLK